MEIDFSASEYCADGAFEPVQMSFIGSPDAGWQVFRNGEIRLNLGSGYRALRVRSCGVCSTDLARRFLPFPLPQITGHEVLAEDESGQRCVVEINASHAARGVATSCPFCDGGLPSHCPERLVLGIHDLPGGFGPWLLAPTNAILPLPDIIPDDAAVLVEPLAAALHAVDRIVPQSGETIAVLGPRRLGMLVVAALAARRKELNADYRILALARHTHLLALAERFGAEESRFIAGAGEGLGDEIADVVIDTTGSPAGFELALRLARREVHLKSTHGRPAGGVEHLTEFVVDELKLEREQAGDPSAVETATPRPTTLLVEDAAGFARAVRPDADSEEAAIMPRGRVLLRSDAEVGGASLLRAVRDRNLVLSSSRCGDFRAAIGLLETDAELREIGARLITHRFSAIDLNHVFGVAASPACIKAVVTH